MRANAPGEHPPKIVNGFRLRGHREVSRIESFSDAVFGFSITLLVVSLQVPETFDDLLRTLSRFPTFALTFALIAQIWFIQYRFFRRFALQDGTTIFLNLALLFVIVFFTYPLKFVFGLVSSSAATGHAIREDQFGYMYGVYALGFAAVFGIFLLMHAHALSKRVELELTPLEIFDTRIGMARSVFQIIVAAVSVTTAALLTLRHDYDNARVFGGLAFLLIPVGGRVITIVSQRRRNVLVAAGG